MKTPTTMEEYLHLVDQATFEAGDLVMLEGGDEAVPDIDTSDATTLEQQVKALQDSITDGSYQFADQDLPFMAMLNKPGLRIPFADMLELINDTHRNGLGA